MKLKQKETTDNNNPCLIKGKVEFIYLAAHGSIVCKEVLRDFCLKKSKDFISKSQVFCARLFIENVANNKLFKKN